MKRAALQNVAATIHSPYNNNMYYPLHTASAVPRAQCSTKWKESCAHPARVKKVAVVRSGRDRGTPDTGLRLRHEGAEGQFPAGARIGRAPVKAPEQTTANMFAGALPFRVSPSTQRDARELAGPARSFCFSFRPLACSHIRDTLELACPAPLAYYSPMGFLLGNFLSGNGTVRQRGRGRQLVLGHV
jgi:hypothetical protein